MNKIELLGWDILNVIIDYLKLTDIILIATSINTNFCKRVKSKIYLDHILLNKKHNFESNLPDRAILDFHITQKIKHIDEKYYTMVCSKNNSYVDLFEKIITPCVTFPEQLPSFGSPTYIKQYFGGGSVKFGTRSVCHISRNADGLDKIILKIILPSLPDGIEYKNSPDNIINNIQLQLGGKTFFEYTSSQFKHLDFITQLFKYSDNVIYYYIDLSSFFKESSEYLDFFGLRLCDLDYHETTFYVYFNDIFSIIDNHIDIQSQLYNEIKNLLIKDRILLVKYHALRDIQRKPRHQIINRWISWNYSCDVCDNIELSMNQEWHGRIGPVIIKKFMMCFNQKVRLISCLIIVGNLDVFNMTQLINDDCVMDKYIFDFDPINVLLNMTITVQIKFAGSVTNINMDAFFETEKEFIYDNGMVTW